VRFDPQMLLQELYRYAGATTQQGADNAGCPGASFAVCVVRMCIAAGCLSLREDRRGKLDVRLKTDDSPRLGVQCNQLQLCDNCKEAQCVLTAGTE
jgi:hypothetical protein